MPKSNYTYNEEKALDSFVPIDNFISNSFTFHNSESGKVIVDAIRTDDSGNIIFKDEKTEVFLKDILGKSVSIDEDYNEDKTFTLYFSDKFNTRHSLGEIYKNLFEAQPKNLIFWFGDRASRFLSEGLDLTILEDYTKTIKGVDLLDPTKDTLITDATDTWKNKWIDIPCLEVIVPDYVDGKYASITSTIVFKIKADKPIVTGFRIYDATAGIELTRVMHTSERNKGKFTTYTVPMHYQGALPDTVIQKNSNFSGLTYQDVQNVQFDKGVETGKDISKNIGQYESVPDTKHVIKLQWITCDLAIELDVLGAPFGDFGRFFDPQGETSLDVTVFSGSLKKNQIVQLNGSIDATLINSDDISYRHVFETIPLGFNKGYSISFSTNKNINIIVTEKTINGFVISWSNPIKGLSIDWSISYKITDKDVTDLDKLNDTKRILNHHLFIDKKFSTDFCNEITDIEGIGFSTGEREVVIEGFEFEPDCVCCDCCTDLVPDVTFKLIRSADEAPDCDTPPFLVCDGGSSSGPRPSSSSEDDGPGYPNLYSSSSSSITALFYRGNFEVGENPMLVFDNSEFFELGELGDLTGLNDVYDFYTENGGPSISGDRLLDFYSCGYALSGGNVIDISGDVEISGMSGDAGVNEELPFDLAASLSNGQCYYVAYAKDSKGNVIYYKTEDSFGNTGVAPSLAVFRFLAEAHNTEYNECYSGFYAGRADATDLENETAIAGNEEETVEDFSLAYDTFVGFDTDAISISGTSVIYSSVTQVSGGDVMCPFFEKEKTYYVVTRQSLTANDPIVYFFQHDESVDLKDVTGTMNIVGLNGQLHFANFFAREPDPVNTDGKDFVAYSFTPNNNIKYADLHIDDMENTDPIEIVAVTDVNPFVPPSFQVTNPKLSRDLLIATIRDAYIDKFPSLVDIINKYVVLSEIEGISGQYDGVTTEIPLDGCVPPINCPEMPERDCTLFSVINGIILDPDDLIKLRLIYELDDVANLLQGTCEDTSLVDISGAEEPKFERDYIISTKTTVGINETVWTVKLPRVSCTEIDSISGDNKDFKEEVIESYSEWFVFPVKPVDAQIEEEEEEDITVTQLITKKTLTLSDIFDSDYTFNGLEFDTEADFIQHIDEIERAFAIGLENLKYDKKQAPNDLPAQLTSSNLINLSAKFSGSYDSLFEPNTTNLSINDPANVKAMPIPFDGFLGVKAFKHNIVVFDPRPNIQRKPDQRPIFPGFDPIYQRRTKDEILEHIYTTVYPSGNIPAFPNFTIGDFTVNGEIYNPLYDYRNFRLLGFYDSKKSKSNTEVFKSLPMKSIYGNFVRGVFVKIDNLKYMITTDFHTSGTVITSKFGNVTQKVVPSKLKFQRVSDSVYNFNSSRTIEL